MADLQARERLRQEREAFALACSQGKAWFTLRLAMGYGGLAVMATILAMASWILLNPQTYGALPLGAAAVTLATQAAGLSFAIARLVLSQTGIIRLTPATSESVEHH